MNRLPRLFGVALATFSLTLFACSGRGNSGSGEAGSPESQRDGTFSEASPDAAEASFDAPIETQIAAGTNDSSDARSVEAVDALSPAMDDGPEASSEEPDTSSGCAAFDPASLNDAAVAAGLAFIESTGHCYRCHQSTPVDAGITLAGNDNSVVDGGMVFPPNLTPDPLTGLGCWTDTQMATAILYGFDDRGLELCSVMPKWGVPKGDAAPPLDDASVGNVIAFLRSLPPVFHQVSETTCPSFPVSSDSGE
jgi:hypothetical protein